MTYDQLPQGPDVPGPEDYQFAGWLFGIVGSLIMILSTVHLVGSLSTTRSVVESFLLIVCWLIVSYLYINMMRNIFEVAKHGWTIPKDPE